MLISCWLPNLFSAAALAMCLIQGWRLRSVGLILLGVYIADQLYVSIIGAVRQRERDAEYLSTFVPRQIAPDE